MRDCTSARAHWIKDLVDKCPSCGKPGDTSTHVTRCKDPSRVITFNQLVKALSKWIEDNDTEPHLLTMITNYLKGRDKTTMESVVIGMHTCLWCYSGRARLDQLAKMQDRLG